MVSKKRLRTMHGAPGSELLHGKFGDYFFPWKPKNVKVFISGLFWHSLALTGTTPLERMRGQWQGILTVPWLLNMLGVRTLSGQQWEDTYLVYPKEADAPGIDKSFGLHAFCGMLWLFLAYIQMVHVKKWGGARLHRKCGYIVSLAFLAHMSASCNILYTDVTRNPIVVKIMLFSVVCSSATYFSQAMKYAFEHEIQLHTDSMVRCFLYSIEGAGTIRTVGWIMWMVGKGPTFCQTEHGSLSDHCIWPYVSRLLCIRVLTVYWLGFYTRIRDDRAFTSTYLTEVKSVALTTFIGLFAAYVAPPEDYLELILSQGGFICYLVLLLYTVFGAFYLSTPFIHALTPIEKFRAGVKAVIAANRMKQLTYHLFLQSKQRITPVIRFKAAVKAVIAANRIKRLTEYNEIDKQDHHIGVLSFAKLDNLSSNAKRELIQYLENSLEEEQWNESIINTDPSQHNGKNKSQTQASDLPSVRIENIRDYYPGSSPANPRYMSLREEEITPRHHMSLRNNEITVSDVGDTTNEMVIGDKHERSMIPAPTLIRESKSFSQFASRLSETVKANKRKANEEKKVASKKRKG